MCLSSDMGRVCACENRCHRGCFGRFDLGVCVRPAVLVNGTSAEDRAGKSQGGGRLLTRSPMSLRYILRACQERRLFGCRGRCSCRRLFFRLRSLSDSAQSFVVCGHTTGASVPRPNMSLRFAASAIALLADHPSAISQPTSLTFAFIGPRRRRSADGLRPRANGPWSGRRSQSAGCAYTPIAPSPGSSMRKRRPGFLSRSTYSPATTQYHCPSLTFRDINDSGTTWSSFGPTCCLTSRTDFRRGAARYGPEMGTHPCRVTGWPVTTLSTNSASWKTLTRHSRRGGTLAENSLSRGHTSSSKSCAVAIERSSGGIGCRSGACCES